MREISRRSFLASATGFVTTPVLAQQPATSSVMIVHKDPSCGCCSGWVEHVRAVGFRVEVIEIADLAPLKARLGVPAPLASCHTAEIGGYVVEGHVPASTIGRLLLERPAATGLAVRGMPVGSPGMEISGSPDQRYDVILFGPSSRRVYASFLGPREL